MATETKQRRPKARHRDVIFGAIDERMQVLASSPDTLQIHLDRINELLAELKRSLNGKQEQESE